MPIQTELVAANSETTAKVNISSASPVNAKTPGFVRGKTDGSQPGSRRDRARNRSTAQPQITFVPKSGVDVPVVPGPVTEQREAHTCCGASSVGSTSPESTTSQPVVEQIPGYNARSGPKILTVPARLGHVSASISLIIVSLLISTVIYYFQLDLGWIYFSFYINPEPIVTYTIEFPVSEGDFYRIIEQCLAYCGIFECCSLFFFVAMIIIDLFNVRYLASPINKIGYCFVTISKIRFSYWFLVGTCVLFHHLAMEAYHDTYQHTCYELRISERQAHWYPPTILLRKHIETPQPIYIGLFWEIFKIVLLSLSFSIASCYYFTLFMFLIRREMYGYTISIPDIESDLASLANTYSTDPNLLAYIHSKMSNVTLTAETKKNIYNQADSWCITNKPLWSVAERNSHITLIQTILPTYISDLKAKSDLWSSHVVMQGITTQSNWIEKNMLPSGKVLKQ